MYTLQIHSYYDSKSSNLNKSNTLSMIGSGVQFHN